MPSSAPLGATLVELKLSQEIHLMKIEVEKRLGGAPQLPNYPVPVTFPVNNDEIHRKLGAIEEKNRQMECRIDELQGSVVQVNDTMKDLLVKMMELIEKPHPETTVVSVEKKTITKQGGGGESLGQNSIESHVDGFNVGFGGSSAFQDHEL